MHQVTLQVKGMSCQHCVNAIENALQQIGALGKVDLKNETVIVEYDKNTLSLHEVKAIIEEQGYDVV